MNIQAQIACDSLSTIHGLAATLEEIVHGRGKSDEHEYYAIATAIKGLADSGLKAAEELTE